MQSKPLNNDLGFAYHGTNQPHTIDSVHSKHTCGSATKACSALILWYQLKAQVWLATREWTLFEVEALGVVRWLTTSDQESVRNTTFLSGKCLLQRGYNEASQDEEVESVALWFFSKISTEHKMRGCNLQNEAAARTAFRIWFYAELLEHSTEKSCGRVKFRISTFTSLVTSLTACICCSMGSVSAYLIGLFYWF